MIAIFGPGPWQYGSRWVEYRWYVFKVVKNIEELYIELDIELMFEIVWICFTYVSHMFHICKWLNSGKVLKKAPAIVFFAAQASESSAAALPFWSAPGASSDVWWCNEIHTSSFASFASFPSFPLPPNPVFSCIFLYYPVLSCIILYYPSSTAKFIDFLHWWITFIQNRFPLFYPFWSWSSGPLPASSGGGLSPWLSVAKLSDVSLDFYQPLQYLYQPQPACKCSRNSSKPLGSAYSLCFKLV